MSTLRGLLLMLIAFLFMLAAILGLRTLLFRPLGARAAPTTLALAQPIRVDVERAAAHLGEAVRFRTISHQDPAANDWQEWRSLHDWLVATYPSAHAAMSREVLEGYALLYTWPGRDARAAPIILMAHQDVVPVTPGSEATWRRPPFSGAIADGAVWGRGTVDDKGSLIALFEAVESLAARGWQPRRTLIIVSGHDEEAAGTGARAVGAALAARGTRAEFVLDEGLAIVTDLAVAKRPTALIGIAEKGYATLRVSAPAKGGHSSTPPAETGVQVLARAVLAIADHPFPLQLNGPVSGMLRALAPEGGLLMKVAVANEWLFGPLLKQRLGATPEGRATMHTTIAPTMLQGSPKENVLPQDATAWINYRIAPGDTSARVMQRAQTATQGLKVKLDWERAPQEPSPVSPIDSDAYRLIAAVASEGGQIGVAPGLVLGMTDSRSLLQLSRNVYRFVPVAASLQELAMIHGTNEHLTLANLERMVRFHAQLIETATR